MTPAALAVLALTRDEALPAFGSAFTGAMAVIRRPPGRDTNRRGEVEA